MTAPNEDPMTNSTIFEPLKLSEAARQTLRKAFRAHGILRNPAAKDYDAEKDHAAIEARLQELERTLNSTFPGDVLIWGVPLGPDLAAELYARDLRVRGGEYTDSTPPPDGWLARAAAEYTTRLEQWCTFRWQKKHDGLPLPREALAELLKNTMGNVHRVLHPVQNNKAYKSTYMKKRNSKNPSTTARQREPEQDEQEETDFVQDEQEETDFVAAQGDETQPWECNLCRENLKEPVELITCTHRYCLGCITKWGTTEPGTMHDVDVAMIPRKEVMCPVCRTVQHRPTVKDVSEDIAMFVRVRRLSRSRLQRWRR